MKPDHQLLAEWHGWDINLITTSGGDPFCYSPQKNEELRLLAGGREIMLTNDLKYHSDWRWIMSVVDKVSKMGYSVMIDTWAGCEIYDCSKNMVGSPVVAVDKEDEAGNKLSTLQVVYQAMVEFVKLQTT